MASLDKVRIIVVGDSGNYGILNRFENLLKTIYDFVSKPRIFIVCYYEIFLRCWQNITCSFDGTQ